MFIKNWSGRCRSAAHWKSVGSGVNPTLLKKGEAGAAAFGIVFSNFLSLLGKINEFKRGEKPRWSYIILPNSAGWNGGGVVYMAPCDRGCLSKYPRYSLKLMLAASSYGRNRISELEGTNKAVPSYITRMT